jgi:hypothetical protein
LPDGFERVLFARMYPDRRIPFAVMLVVAVGLIGLGVVYLVTPAAHLPTWMPGHIAAHTLRNGHVVHPSAHVGRGITLVVVGVIIAVIAWWYAYRYNAEPAPSASGGPNPA